MPDLMTPAGWLPLAFYLLLGLSRLAYVILEAFYGLAYSLFTYLVMDRMTLWQAAASPEALWLIFLGACAMLPIIVASSLFVYRVFGGKAQVADYT